MIGAVLGVIAFIALIAGATFAWLTGTFSVTSGSYTGSSKNLVINYTGDAAIGNNLVVIDKADAKAPKIKNGAATAATENDGWIQVKASKTANDVAIANFHIMLHLETNTMATNSLVWAACESSKCPADTAVLISAISTSGNSPTATCATNVQCGVIKHGQTTSRTSYSSNTDIVLFNDNSTFNKTAKVDEVTYNVYFWVDGPTYSNSDLNKTVQGYVYAEAVQTAS